MAAKYIGMDSIVAGSVWARANLSPKNLGWMAGQASRAAHADVRAVFLGIGWAFVPEDSEDVVNRTDAPKVLRLLLMFKGRASPRVKVKMHEKR